MPNNIFDPFAGNNIYTGQTYSSSGPAYQRVSSIPSWLPTQAENERQLMEQYRGTNRQFDTGAYDQASEEQQSRVLTTAMNAGNNAAAEYANRARQAGGSGQGAGLIKAEAQTGARATAGAMELDRQRFDADQRSKAAGHAAQIASTLGQLRQSYLSSLVDYATREDTISADYSARMAALPRNQRGGSPMLFPIIGQGGLPANPGEFRFNNMTDYMRYLQRMSNENPAGASLLTGG